MMKIKYLLIPVTALSFAFSALVFADKPEGKGTVSDARWKNSNRQSGEYSKKGKERAEERHELKEKKHKDKKKKHSKHKKGKHSDKYRREYDRDRDRNNDRYKERRDKKRDHDDEYRKEMREEKGRYSDKNKERNGSERDRYERRSDDQYDNRREAKTVRQNPVDAVIDKNVNDVKSTIDAAQRKMNEMIDGQSKAFTDGVNAPRDLPKEETPWWELSQE